VYLPRDDKPAVVQGARPTYYLSKQDTSESFSSVSVGQPQQEYLGHTESSRDESSFKTNSSSDNDEDFSCSAHSSGSRKSKKRARFVSEVLHAPVVEVKPVELPEEECPVPEWKLLEERVRPLTLIGYTST
jgi:hypothetical protein